MRAVDWCSAGGCGVAGVVCAGAVRYSSCAAGNGGILFIYLTAAQLESLGCSLLDVCIYI